MLLHSWGPSADEPPIFHLCAGWVWFSHGFALWNHKCVVYTNFQHWRDRRVKCTDVMVHVRPNAHTMKLCVDNWNKLRQHEQSPDWNTGRNTHRAGFVSRGCSDLDLVWQPSLEVDSLDWLGLAIRMYGRLLSLIPGVPWSLGTGGCIQRRPPDAKLNMQAQHLRYLDIGGWGSRSLSIKYVPQLQVYLNFFVHHKKYVMVFGGVCPTVSCLIVYPGRLWQKNRIVSCCPPPVVTASLFSFNQSEN